MSAHNSLIPLDEEHLTAPSLDHETRACLRLWAASFAEKIRAFVLERANREFNGVWHYWLLVEQDVYPGSFLWLCALFGRDPDAVRNSILMRWRELHRAYNMSTKSLVRRKKCRE